MYALLDAFVVPRRDERAARLVTPLKPFEAMAMARPLIVADLPALTEVAPDGERSLAYRAEDATALAAAVVRLMDHPDAGRPAGRDRAGVGHARADLGVQRPALDRDLRVRAGSGDADRRAVRGRVVNLVLRGVATDAAQRGAGHDRRAADPRGGSASTAPAVWVAHGTTRFDATAAWDHGIALVRVNGPEAEAAALDVVRAVGARVGSRRDRPRQRRARPEATAPGWRRATSSACGRTRRSRSCWARTGIRRRSPNASRRSTRGLPPSPACRAGSCWPR